MLPQAEKIARLALARTDGVGPITFRRLIERYGTAARALAAMPDLAKRGGRAKPLVPFRLQDAEAEAARITKMGGFLLVWGDDDYPAQLAAIEDAPMALTVLGDATLLNKPGIGIVGSRNASLQGRKLAEHFAADLGRAGLTIISGLARGIDTAAHTASLPTGTIAVVAGGADVIYPAENKALYERITAGGAIIAENPLGMQPMAQHFPRRNRIISGLSRGVVIVEANLKSGSLITAGMAADQGREVFAVPGHPFDPRAAGPNNLIRDGATIVTSAKDILDALARMRSLRIVSEPQAMPPEFTSAEPDAASLDQARNLIVPLLSAMAAPVDELIRASGLPTPVVQTILLELELAGRLVRHPQNRVSMPFSDEVMDRTPALL